MTEMRCREHEGVFRELTHFFVVNEGANKGFNGRTDDIDNLSSGNLKPRRDRPGDDINTYGPHK
jgi:hypothetical protein